MMGGGGLGHSFQSPGALFHGPGHSDWLPGSCAGHHTGCEIGLLEIEEMLRNADVDALRELMESRSTHVKYSAATGLLEILDCDGVHRSQYRLSEDLQTGLGQ
jgi:hypothetical protein